MCLPFPKYPTGTFATLGCPRGLPNSFSVLPCVTDHLPRCRQVFICQLICPAIGCHWPCPLSSTAQWGDPWTAPCHSPQLSFTVKLARVTEQGRPHQARPLQWASAAPSLPQLVMRNWEAIPRGPALWEARAEPWATWVPLLCFVLHVISWLLIFSILLVFDYAELMGLKQVRLQVPSETSIQIPSSFRAFLFPRGRSVEGVSLQLPSEARAQGRFLGPI